MAPRNQNPLDPQRIDIGLELVGGAALDVMNRLIERLSAMETTLAAQAASGAGGRAAGAARVGSSTRRNVYDGGGLSPSASQVHMLPEIPDNSGQFASVAGDDVPHGWLNRKIAKYAQTESDQRRSLTGSRQGGSSSDYFLNPTPPGSLSTSASLPGSGFSTDPMGRTALRADTQGAWEDLADGYRLPPGGLSLNWQDKIRMAASAFGRGAENRYQAELKTIPGRLSAAASDAGFSQSDIAQLSPEEMNDFMPDINVDMSNVGARRFKTAAALRYASNQAAPITALKDAAMNVYGASGDIQQQGVAAGYTRAGQINIPGTNIGITNPFDFLRGGSAANEGLRQRFDEMKLRFMGGINGEQANQIVQGLAGSGWTGHQGHSAAFDAIAPLVQQGQDPRLAVAAYDTAMRQGNTSLEDFLKTMDGLGKSAQAANMNLSEYTQGLMDFNDQAKQLGSVGIQGATLGRAVSEINGVAPQVTAQAFQSPMFQGMALGQGFLPSQLGMMSPGDFIQTQYRAIDFAAKAAASFKLHPMRDSRGRIIPGSGEQALNQQIAQMTGLGDANYIQRLRRQERVGKAAGFARDDLDQYGRDTAIVDREVKRRGPGNVTLKQNQHYEAGDLIPATMMAGPAGHSSGAPQPPPGAIHMANGMWAVKAKHAGYGDVYSDNAEKAMADAAYAQAGNKDWSLVAKDLRQMAPDRATDPKAYKKYMARVDALSKEHGDNRVKAARDLIAEQNKVGDPNQDNPNAVSVKFTGLAAKFFEQDKSALKEAKRIAGSGGTSATSYATSPGSSTTDYGQSILGAASGGP